MSSSDDGDDFEVSVGDAGVGEKGVIQLAGCLGGSAAAPDVRKLRVEAGAGDVEPQILEVGSVSAGEVLTRVGSTLVGRSVLLSAGGTLEGDLAMGGNKVTGLPAATDPGDAISYGQVTSMLSGLDWQASVLSILNDPPATPAAGQRHLIGVGTGLWLGQDDAIAQWTGSAWSFIVPNTGYTVHVDTTGSDYTFNGTSWVNIGASVDHAALLNLATGDPHTQYQLVALKDASSGYAGLDSGAHLIAPVKRIRIVTSTPSGTTPGEVWVHGPDLLFKNDDVTPAIETAERISRKGQPSGYAGLDSSGKVTSPPQTHASTHLSGGSDALPIDAAGNVPALRTLGSGSQQACAGTDARLTDARSPTAHASSHGAMGSDAITPSAIGAAEVTRQVTGGAGLSGGGNLSANRVLAIASFTGAVAKDVDPGSLTWSASQSIEHLTVDIGAEGQLLLMGVRLPPTVDAALVNEVLIYTSDNLSTPASTISNSSTSSVLDLSMTDLVWAVTGDLATAAANNGKRVQKVILRTRNTSGSGVSSVDIGWFRLRAWAFPRGEGLAL